MTAAPDLGDPRGWARVVSEILRRIDCGELKPGGKVPSKSVLAGDVGVSTYSVGQALDFLAGQGLMRMSPQHFYVLTPSARERAAELTAGMPAAAMGACRGPGARPDQERRVHKAGRPAVSGPSAPEGTGTDGSRLARAIRRFRVEGRMTMGQMAALLGLDRSVISRIERGERSPAMRARGVAKALGITVEELLAPCPHCRYEPDAGYQCLRCGTPGPAWDASRQDDEAAS